MSYKAFAVTPANNSKNNDASGAFIPGAQHFAKAFKGTFKTFNNVHGQSKKNFLAEIDAAPGPLDLFAYFGHGWNTQLHTAEIYTESDINELAEALKAKLKPNSIAIFYACLAGIENGFTLKLQQKLGADVWIYGHTSVGHSFANPDVSEAQRARNPGYRRLYPYGTDLRGPWAEALLYTDMWLRFPIMWDVYIERELYAIRLLGTWKVTIGGKAQTYTFKWSKTDGTFDDLDSINQNPSGTVSATGGGAGTWTIDEQVQISWNSGAKETWNLPLKVAAQTGSIDGIPLTATRLTHTKPGKAQG